MMFDKINTGKIFFDINQTDRTLITDKINGKVEKVVITYNKETDQGAELTISTSDDEKIINSIGNESSVFYPRNLNVQSQKYRDINVGEEGEGALNADRFILAGEPLTIHFKGMSDKDIIENIKIIIDGEIIQEVAYEYETEITAESEDTNITKEGEGAGEGTVTSTTEGVYGASHGRRKKLIKQLIDKSMNDICKAENITGSKLPLSAKEKGKMADFIVSNFWKTKFQNMSKGASNRIRDFMVKAMIRGDSIERMTKYIDRKGKDKLSFGKAETIARTEFQALTNSIREFNFKKIDPEGKRKYVWLGPSDDRETQVCKNIKSRTGKGVSLDKLREIVKQESIKGGFDGKREFTPHPNCRHGLILRPKD